MKSHEVRSLFLNYFKEHSHQEVKSSSLVPHDDPTLLFTNAGMNQFKNVFLGLEQRDYSKAVSSQKCVRAGGKHNDLENVGFTARHHTFFEMLGNFSLGDYFKKEAIHYSWDFITKQLGLEKDRLYVTVFKDDDEAAELWHKQEGVPKDRIYRFGEKDNFWRMGDTGPCGPCSEIFYDLGPEVGGDPKQNVMGGEGDRYMEFWNLVFMQYHEDESGKMTPLPKPSIDTGMGLERLSAIVQKQLNNYHTDGFLNLINKAMQVSGKEYIKNLPATDPNNLNEQQINNVAFRVLADHARSTAFLIADGVLPSNEGRGYVLRRIMRRAIRYGRKLSNDSILPTVVEAVIDSMGGFFPELKQQSSLILTTTKDEEKRFLSTLDQGTQILMDEVKAIKNKGQKGLSGELVFKLYDTFGFPSDLTAVIARENQLSIDNTGFEKLMQEAKVKARASWKGKSLNQDQAHIIEWVSACKSEVDTEFLGYDKTKLSSNIIALSNGSKKVNSLKAGDSGLLISKQTCFYAESGGQVGDQGQLLSNTAHAEVLDCTKQDGVHIHHIKVIEGVLKTLDTINLEVTDSTRRQSTCNHTATHLLHAALKKQLGDHINQAGSLVEPLRLRFDFTHNKPLTNSELEKIESLVNNQIYQSLFVHSKEMTHKQALNEGALALFGEKYGDHVRTIKIDDFSFELCGGTHVKNTSEIRLFKIVSETGVSAGIRRIEALTGDAAFKYLNHLAQENLKLRSHISIVKPWNEHLESTHDDLILNFDKQKENIKELKKELQAAAKSKINVDDIIADSKKIKIKEHSISVVVSLIEVDDRKVLSELADQIRDKMKSSVVVLFGKTDGDSHPALVTVSKDLCKQYKAGVILKAVAELMGGKGGGRPDFAQGAVTDLSKFAQAKDLVLKQIQI